MHQVLPPTGLAYSAGVPATAWPLPAAVNPVLSCVSIDVAASRLVRARTTSGLASRGTSEAR